MKRFLLKCFVWISLLSIAAASCRSARISYSGDQAGLIMDTASAGSFEKMTFKIKVISGERELDGIMLVKKVPGGNLRIAFYNELGMTYLEGTLDLSSKNQKLIVKNIAPVINYKVFIKNFEKCLQTVFTKKSNPRHSYLQPRPTASLPPATDETIISAYLHKRFWIELSPK